MLLRERETLPKLSPGCFTTIGLMVIRIKVYENDRKWGAKVYLTTKVYLTIQRGPRHRFLYRNFGFETKTGELIIRNCMVMESEIRRMNDNG